LALAIFLWWLILFGFSQNASSEFGENLDRNRLKNVQMAGLPKTKSEVAKNEEKSDEKFEGKFVGKENEKENVFNSGELGI
jgi:hypothetical protein